MSFFRSIGKVIGTVARAAAPIATVINPVLGGSLSVAGQLGQRSSLVASLPAGMGSLPQLGRAMPALAAAGTAVMVTARAAMRSANIYCRRHPVWCASIGGTLAISDMILGGTLPVIRRRRGRGITPRDLRSFRRVAGLIRGFCPTVRRIPSRAIHARKTGIIHA
jgi:hypothetical protein